MKPYIKILLTFFLFNMTISCATAPKETPTYGEMQPTTELTFSEPLVPDTAPWDPKSVCTQESLYFYKKLLKDNTQRRHDRLVLYIEATKMVEMSLDNYIAYESKQYGQDIFSMKDQLLYTQIIETLNFIKGEGLYNAEFDQYANRLELHCPVSYCNDDLKQLKSLDRILEQAIFSQEKLFALKFELMSGLYSYKVKETLTLDQLSQLQSSIKSSLDSSKIQEKSVELNERALNLFKNNFNKLCKN